MFSAGHSNLVLLKGYCHQRGEEENVSAWIPASVGSRAVQMEKEARLARPPALI